MTFLLWIAFLLLVVFFVFLDLGLFHKHPRAMKPLEALSWTLFWIGLALIFNLGLYFIYEYGSFEDSLFLHPKPGKEAALEFFTGYLIEKSLSLDNIFVISLIFSYYHIPLVHQQHVLSIGILTAALLRGLLILFGVGLVHSFSWILYLFGAFLVYSGLRLLFYPGGTHISTENVFIKAVNRFIPVSTRVDHSHFFIKEEGAWKMTPLFLALLQIETADVMFAIDSIPAIFAITLDPFIVFTSNIFAIFGLRSLYFALAPLIERFRYLKTSLASILVYVGIKMLLAEHYKIPNLFSLALILGILLCGILASLRFPEKSLIPEEFRGQNLLTHLFTYTFQQIRRVVVFTLGISVLLVGVVLLFIPGPALVVIPIGLLILSSEFLWARKLLQKLKHFIQNKS